MTVGSAWPGQGRTGDGVPAERRPSTPPRTQEPVHRPADRGATRHREAVLGALLVGMTLAAYLPALHAGFVFDDSEYVTENDTLRTIVGLGHIWLTPQALPQYYPLTFTSFWVEYHLWGLAPVGYHAVNILLHALNAVLVWRILRRMRLPGAWIAAAIFALHPVHVESVAWVAERKNVLSGLFSLATLLVLLPWMIGERRELPWRSYVLAVLCFVAALLSKTVTCTLPVALFLLVWWARGTIDRGVLWRLAPLCVLGLAMAWMTVAVERSDAAVAATVSALSLLERGLVAGRAFWFYPQLLLWPYPLAVIYPRWEVDAHVWWQYLFPAAAAVVIRALFAMRRRIGNGPLVAVLLYGIFLGPTSGVFTVAFMRFAFVADHFAYLPSIPLIALATALGVPWLRRRGAAARWLIPAVCTAALASLGALTAWQCTIYRDPRTLWADTLSKTPASWVAHNNLGALLTQDGRTTEGITHLTEALRLNPEFAEAHNNLGTALQALGRLDEAGAQYAEALRLQPFNWEATNNLGTVLQAEGRLDEAMAQYAEALRLRPTHAKALNNVASILQARGAIAEAVAQYERVLQSNPDQAEAHNNLATALAVQGQHAAAAAECRTALRLKPDYPEAHYNLGISLHAQGQTEDAIAQFREALRLRPAYPEAHNNLGKALAAQGLLDEAIVEYSQAVQAKPDFSEAHNNLANALRLHGALDDAIRHYLEALRLRPTYPEAHNNYGSALAAQGQPDAAIAQFMEALRLKPDYAEAHYNLATVLLAERRLDEATAHFVTALQLRPDDAATHNNLGYVLFEQGQVAEAIAEYERALRIDDRFPEAHTNLATALAAAGQTAAAVAHYEAALRLKPDHAAAHHGLGLLLVQIGPPDRAIAELEAAARLDPGDGDARRQLELLQDAQRHGL